LTALGITALIVWAIAYGRRHRIDYDGHAATRFERGLAFTNIAVWLASHGYWQLPERFDAVTTLPLQMCHITSLIASAVLLTRSSTLRAVLYFWSFGLCTQALITPSLKENIDSPIFWAFWFLHGFVMLTAIYDIVVHRFRPTWRDYGIACAAAVVYVAVVLPVDLLLGANYGFLGPSKPLNPSIVDLLGAWPQRLAIIVPLAALAMLVVFLPWLVARRLALSPARR